MLKIGLTGGIGSGKSTVAAIFEVLGIPVYDADTAAKRLMNEDEALKAAITASFGEASYINGQLDRNYLSATVFSDPGKLALLNDIVHPATIADARRWFRQQSAPYAIKEAALIFESQSHVQLDFVIGVYAPPELRILRAMERDQSTREQVEARMHKQMDEAEKLMRCDFVIHNDEKQLLIPQVIALHDKLCSLSQEAIS